jgi:hypothetical protein
MPPINGKVVGNLDILKIIKKGNNNMNTNQLIETIIHVVALLGLFIAAYKITTELKQARIQRHMDLRWKQANAAREILKDMLASPLANDATIMMESTGKEFTIATNQKATITFAEIQNALRTNNVQLTSKEVYIRDCTSTFLFHVELIEQALRNELIEFKDIKFPMECYIAALRKNDLYNAYTNFIKEYDYKNAERFLSRFHAKLKTSKTMS